MGAGSSPCCGAAWRLLSGRGAAPASSRNSSATGSHKIVIQKYCMLMSREDIMGEGTSSICRRGLEIKTDREVAIKIYKQRKGSDKSVENMKFKNQIKVLKELQQEFRQPAEQGFWHPELEHVRPSKVFMQLVDFSQDWRGNPCPDRHDRVSYVVTELGSYSLKDYLRQRKREHNPMSVETVRGLTKTIVLVVAALHAKGLVHLDLKPDNIMLFSGCLKLIDVDGCVRSGHAVSPTDSALSFTPCYCAPEWAHFLVEGGGDPIKAAPALDVWSAGMTICELLVLDAALKPTYASFLRHGQGHRQAGFLFLEWLSRLKKVGASTSASAARASSAARAFSSGSASSWSLPRPVVESDPQLQDLLSNWLLVCNLGDRRTAAEALSHQFLKTADLRKAGTGPLDASVDLTSDTVPLPTSVMRHHRPRMEDHDELVVYNGTLHKLSSGKDALDRKAWERRDVWISAHGHLGYFSQKDQKRLVLLSAHQLSVAIIERFSGRAVFEYAMEIKTVPDHEDHAEGEHECYLFACDSAEDLGRWLDLLDRVRHQTMATMNLGGDFAKELHKFTLTVKNRRQKLQEGYRSCSQVFRDTLWKVKSGGNRMRPEDWYERDMWLNADGDLVYFSKKDDCKLIYYTADDIQSAQISRLAPEQASKPWAFQLRLPVHDGLEFAPGEFAAVSKAQRELWIKEFVGFGAADPPDGVPAEPPRRFL